MAVNAVEQIARAISEGFKLVAQVLAGSESRRMRKCIEYGERFIRKADDLGLINDPDLQDLEERFYRYNN